MPEVKVTNVIPGVEFIVEVEFSEGAEHLGTVERLAEAHLADYHVTDADTLADWRHEYDEPDTPLALLVSMHEDEACDAAMGVSHGL